MTSFETLSSEPFRQREAGIFVYPASLLRKFAWRLPLILWRTGLAPVFSVLPMVVITTRGRKSGQPRAVMTDYTGLDGKTYVVPGWGSRNQWYRNIENDPRVTLQKSGRTMAASAHRVIDPQELADFFHRVRRVNPMWKRYLRSWDISDDVNDFLRKRERIVVVRLDEEDGPAPLPALPVDLWWVWPAVGLGVLAWQRSARARRSG